MLAKELLEKIKEVTNQILFTKEVEVEATFATEKLKDSLQEVKYAELAVGTPVFKASATGDIPIEDGDYTTDSGNTFTTKDGKITAFVNATPDSPVEDAPEELAKVEPVVEPVVVPPVAKKAKVEPVQPANSDLLKRIEALEAEISAMKDAETKEDAAETAEDSKFSKLEKDVMAIAELLNVIAKTPAEFSKTDNRAEAADDKQNKLKNLADIISPKN